VEWLYSAIFQLVLTSLVAILAWRKLKNYIWDTIDDFGSQFAEKLNEQLGSLISPVVKKGFSLAGSLGGEAKATKELQGRLAKNFIDTNYGEIKMVAERVLNIDVDELIEDYGAPTVIKAIQGFLPIFQGGGGKGLLGGLLGGKNNPRSGNVPSM
jgi:hypothetical protein